MEEFDLKTLLTSTQSLDQFTTAKQDAILEPTVRYLTEYDAWNYGRFNEGLPPFIKGQPQSVAFWRDTLDCLIKLKLRTRTSRKKLQTSENNPSHQEFHKRACVAKQVSIMTFLKLHPATTPPRNLSAWALVCSAPNATCTKGLVAALAVN